MSTLDPATLIAALTAPGALPVRRGVPVEVAQTHVSIVFLAADRAWKVKKPVRLGFLDFSTLEARRAVCADELRLNRRLAPELYLALRPIVRREGAEGLRLVDAAREGDEVVEWAIEMQRLPAEGMLDRLLAKPPNEVEFLPAALDAFADELAAFHARAASGPDVAAFGAIERVRERLEDNLARLRRHGTAVSTGASTAAEAPLAAEFVDGLTRAARRELERAAPLLERRRAAGRVREGHGDLHARNLCLVDGRIVAYDCLEFEAAFRCADVASEAGFLAMDLDLRGRPDLATRFVDRYRAASGDDEVAQVVPFFRLHYAIIRAMVEAIRLEERETPLADRPGIRALVRRYAALAAGYVVEPALVVMTGLPATGKSTLAREIGRSLRAEVLRSDAVRKAGAGVAPTERGGPALYSGGASDATYAALAASAATALARGRSVVVDAAHLRAADRRRTIAVAGPAIPWLVVETCAEESAIRRRMAARAADPSEISDATWEVYLALRAEREPLTEIPAARVVSVESSAEADAQLIAVAERLLAIQISSR